MRVTPIPISTTILPKPMIEETQGAIRVTLYAEPTPQVTPQVRMLLISLESGALSRIKLQESVGIKDREHFRKAILDPLLSGQLIERTIPELPTSRLQQYRLTNKGRLLLETLATKRKQP